MPRKSRRRKTIELLQLEIKQLKKESILREIMSEEDSDEDDIYIQKQQLCDAMIRTRYLFRRSKYRKDRKKFDLEDALSYDSINYNEEEFLGAFRVSRDSFFLLLEEMKTRKAFIQISKKKNSDLFPFNC